MICLYLFIFSLNPKNEIGVSGDYFAQNYIVIDTVTRDTSALDTELRLFWDFWLESAEKGNDRIGIRQGEWSAGNGLAFSTRSIRDRLNLSATLPVSSWLELQGKYDGELQYYHPGFLLKTDSVSYTSYLNNNLSLELDFALGSGWNLNLSEGLELQRYLPEDSFNTSYLLNRVRLGAELKPDDGLFFTLVYGNNRLLVPRADTNNYAEHTVYGGAEVYTMGGSRFGIDNYFARRRYPDRFRSYWEEHPNVTFTQDFGTDWALTIEEDFRLTQFDETTAVYQNQAENRLKLEGEWRLGSSFALRFGPHWELSRNTQRQDEQDYNEWAFSLGAEVFTPGGLGLTIEDRLGMRRYIAADSGFQSDYRFNEFNLYSNWQFLTTRRGGLILEGMINIAPEWHREAIDNLAAFSYSFGLKFRF
ncbi:hypothetical protein HPY86_03410 [candidate division WOR-3 bacterium]|nr:hypothetical protein [candidate division WOR-3 bacterium]